MTEVLYSQRQMAPDADRTGEVTRADLEAICRTLRASGASLRARSTAAVADALGRVSTAWLADDSPWRARAGQTVAANGGMTPQMMDWSLKDLFRRMSSAGLIALVEQELGSREPFGAIVSGGARPCARSVHPPRLLVQVLAGTVPPVTIEAIVLALLARAPVLIKTSSQAPILARLYLESLRAIAPELAASVAVCTWAGGDNTLESYVATQVDALSIYGSDEAVEAWKARLPFTTRFSGYGHRVSFAVIGPTDGLDRRNALPEVAEQLALDVAAYDQRGCMSPHCVFVHRDAPWSATDLANALATHGFPRVAARLPRGPVDDATAAAVMQARGVADITGRALPTEQALVIQQDACRFVPSPGARTLHVVPWNDEAELLGALRPLAGKLSTAGVLMPRPDRDRLLYELGELGIRRVCRLGRMQRPLWMRDHDGRPRIADWVEWNNVEPLYE